EYSKVLNGSIPSPEKGKLYEIELDASISEGYSAISIVLDETMEKNIIAINDTASSGMKYGDLLIAEIMYDPVALSDTDGEWFEVYNHSANEINLKDMVIRTSSGQHVITADIIVAAGEYYLMARKAEAAAGTKYVYGTGISLTNSGGTIGIYTYGTDGTDGMEIANVTYDDGTDFPAATGASLNLSLNHFSANGAKIGSSWCLGSNVYDTGDLGSPGLANRICE
ncbi:MAG TPA: lamin tail domain-containing protein, partial [Bacteroidales bacterium]|nr:lamin tail domain-containing protein [Bacteroidales bacterium]